MMVETTESEPSTPTSTGELQRPPPPTIDTVDEEDLESELSTVAVYIANLQDMLANVVAALGDADGKPPKPIIMAAVTALSKDSWSAWTGGIPKADWTGLLNPSAQLDTSSLNQLSPVYVSAAAQKGYNHRRTGMSTPFKPADSLLGPPHRHRHGFDRIPSRSYGQIDNVECRQVSRPLHQPIRSDPDRKARPNFASASGTDVSNEGAFIGSTFVHRESPPNAPSTNGSRSPTSHPSSTVHPLSTSFHPPDNAMHHRGSATTVNKAEGISLNPALGSSLRVASCRHPLP